MSIISMPASIYFYQAKERDHGKTPGELAKEKSWNLAHMERIDQEFSDQEFLVKGEMLVIKNC